MNSNVFVFLYTTLLKNLRSSSTSTCFHQDALLFKLFRFGRIFSLLAGGATDSNGDRHKQQGARWKWKGANNLNGSEMDPNSA